MLAHEKRELRYSRQCLDQSDIEAVLEVLQSDYLTTGPKVEAFEKAIAAKVGVKYAVAVCNGTMALDLAVKALELPGQFTGLTSPLTFAASANAILYAGGQLDLIDIEEKTPNLSPQALKDYFNQSNQANCIIPVSYAGIPADLPTLQEVAQSHGLKVIEDASHAFGSTYSHEGKDIHCGSCQHSDLAVFSFHPVKNITTAEGGMVTTNSVELYHRLLELRNHGMTKKPEDFQSNHTTEPPPWYYEIKSLGYNARLSEIHAALGLSQLKKLELFKSSRRQQVEKYNQALKDLSLFTTPDHLCTDQQKPFFHLYPLRTRDADESVKLKLFKHLARQNIHCQVHYIPIHWHPHFSKHLKAQKTYPHAESFYLSEISLPLFPSLAEDEQKEVISSILSFYELFKP